MFFKNIFFFAFIVCLDLIRIVKNILLCDIISYRCCDFNYLYYSIFESHGHLYLGVQLIFLHLHNMYNNFKYELKI